MILEKLKTEIRGLVINGRQEEALQLLLKIFRSGGDSVTNKSNQDTVILRSSELNQLKDKIKKNIILPNERDYKYANINNVILELVDEIDKQTADFYNLESSIFNKMVIVCREASRLEEATRIFNKRYYPNAEQPVLATNFIFNKNDNVQLVIYDDFPKRYDSMEINPDLQKILDKTKDSGTHVLVFSPDRIPDLQKRDYVDYVYTSNSKFSVHSRIQEMLLYLKHYNFPKNK